MVYRLLVKEIQHTYIDSHNICDPWKCLRVCQMRKSLKFGFIELRSNQCKSICVLQSHSLVHYEVKSRNHRGIQGSIYQVGEYQDNSK